ncbi:hypothetical protein PHET_05818 [Paragonimus heterotremus]|uniref:DNA mismatch repair protein MutS core domain-containing protein n=1 Tax=Paragonimus heterotremus TaxID=100268 RepID=A0A8J4WHN1_9TREM|nr:hypothetical protein PHET_05818 [Paragonimus heterotremus]
MVLLFTPDKTEFCVLPNRFFSSTNFTSSILSMNFPTIKHLETTEEKEMFVRSLFPPDCNQICKSISALVQFLGNHEAPIELDIFNVPLNVLDIQILNVNDVIYMDGVAMKYLHIFNPKYFGNNLLGGRKCSAKLNNEISIFKFFNVCLTKLGRTTLEQWMRSPLQDVEKINQRLNAIEFLLKTANGTLLKSIRSTLRKVENIPRIFYRMQQSSALPNDWKNLMQSLMSLEQLIGICATHAGELYPVRQLTQEAFEIESLSVIQMWMVRIIDFEAIQKQHRFSVNQGLDSVLDEWIQTYRCLPDLLSQLAEEELKKLREDINSETAIMHRLQDRILEHSKHILRAHQFAAEMDCLCAFAQAASSMKGVRPKLVQESLIRITNGWHPIQQLLSIDTIRNSFSSGGNHGRTTLVTGPNASGKSIYLKQVISNISDWADNLPQPNWKFRPRGKGYHWTSRRNIRNKRRRLQPKRLLRLLT